MIINPDFADHWKTRMLVDALKDEAAPVYLLRLFAHCQNSKRAEFDNMPKEAIKSICRYSGDAIDLEKALTDARWIEREGQMLTVRNFVEYNSQLFANWDNGKKGGRPKKNPSKTHGLAMGNPVVNPNQEWGNPLETDKIREDKRREEKEINTSVGKKARHQFTPPTQDQVEAYCKEKSINIDPAAFVDYYESKGWVVGKSKMRRWESAVNTWGRNAKARDRQAYIEKHGEEPEAEEARIDAFLLFAKKNIEEGLVNVLPA